MSVKPSLHDLGCGSSELTNPIGDYDKLPKTERTNNANSRPNPTSTLSPTSSRPPTSHVSPSDLPCSKAAPIPPRWERIALVRVFVATMGGRWPPTKRCAGWVGRLCAAVRLVFAKGIDGLLTIGFDDVQSMLDLLDNEVAKGLGSRVSSD